MEARVKKEQEETPRKATGEGDGDVKKRAPIVIDLDDTSSSSSDSGDEVPSKKKSRLGVIIPDGFLAPLSTEAPVERARPPRELPPPATTSSVVRFSGAKQFWKAGDYEAHPSPNWDNSGGIDHVRVHPKFLHSNATSHKWALGAFAELLDNSLDEVDSGASYVNIDMLKNMKDGSRMLLIEDNGGGMGPDKMRQCMSLGYSAKSKLANTIGQYGNGFKTSTMRLGADVIVFSRCLGKHEKSCTQSIGLLSYTFLRSTGKEDIIVPMLDYDRRNGGWNPLIRSSLSDWRKNVETITQWSPYSSEAELLRQFSLMKDHGTRIVIYNLWEDDQGLLELDFDADEHDIQLRGVNRDEKNIQMADQFPNSRHFLTYRHSLRSYASILYLRLPSNFRIILRGKDVEHHNIVNDMMFSQEVTYRPQHGVEGLNKDDMAAVVTIGFVKDAKHHIDVQGFNVYHKNRLIKPFWRLWNAAGSGGRGVIGVLEANFVEPAHDKQGFERTTVLARLETKLIQMQKNYWSTNSHRIGYAPCRNKKFVNGSAERESSPDYDTPSKYPRGVASGTKPATRISEKFASMESRRFHLGGRNATRAPSKSGESLSSSEPSSPSAVEVTEHGTRISRPKRMINDSNGKTPVSQKSYNKDSMHVSSPIANLDVDDSEQDHASAERVSGSQTRSKVGDKEPMREENHELEERLAKRDSDMVAELERELQAERERCKTLENQLQEAHEKIEQMNKEQETLIDIFSEERGRREAEEQTLRKKLKEAEKTMEDLLNKVRLLENAKSINLMLEESKFNARKGN